MASTDAVLLLQTCAVAAWGTAGGAILHEQPRNRASVTLLGVGLLVGAILTAIDSEVVGGAGLPLASWSLLLFGLLALVPKDEGLARALCSNGLRLAVTGALAFGLLHWTHRAAPLRPTTMDLASWQAIRGITGALLGWLAWRSPLASGPIRWLLGATAVGVGSSALLGEFGPTAKAVLQCLAVMPMLAIALRQQLAVTTIAAATSLAFGFTSALRASAVQQGRGPQLAGLDDPLLALAVVFGGFGIALHRAHQAMTAAQRGAGAGAIAADPVAAPTPELSPTASAVSPPLAPVPATAPAAEPAPSASIATPNLTTSLAELEDFERLQQGTVDLACAPPNRSAAAPTPAPGDPTTALRGRLLLIDDRSDLQRLLGHLLAQAGAEVTTAETAAEARQLLAQTPFDLVLLDLELPDRDGSALAQELRQQGVTVPIVALTDGSPEAGARSEQAGCSAHVDKPIDFAQLQQELSRHLTPTTS